jgi:hypothetical protein
MSSSSDNIGIGESYRHTQCGWVIVMAIGIVCGINIATASALALYPLFAVTGLLLLLLPLFYSLTIVITSTQLSWYFGVGLIQFKVPISSISSSAILKNPGCSYGIHWSPWGGWLYNVSGSDVVRVSLRDGTAFLLGTNEPARLSQAISSITQH